MTTLRRASLSWKILLGIVPILLLALAISVIVQNRFQEAEMMDQAQVSAHTYATIIRESLVSMMVNSQEVDSTFVLRVGSLQQFDSLKVLVNRLNLREDLFSKEQINKISNKKRNAGGLDSVHAAVLQSGVPVYLRSGDRFRAVIPFNATEVCQKCHAVPVRYTLGAADLRFSLERFSKAAAGNWRRSVLVFVVFTIVTIGIAAVIFKRYITTPVDRLVAATREIQRGNLAYSIAGSKLPTSPSSQDELEFLARRFDEMRQSLADKIARLDQMNRELTKKNTDVEEALDRLRRTQEELVRSERLAVAGQMAAQLSHEINNPIHNTQSLLESSLHRLGGNVEARELLELALDEVLRMGKLTRQLLDVYRGSVVEMPVEQVDLRELLLDIQRTHQESLSKEGVHLVFEAGDDLRPVRGSNDKLRQVFLNLILNARDAMPNGGTVRLRARTTEGFVVVDVMDTGVGIAPEHRSRIFDAFFTTKKKVSGVGIGLSVTYGIIRQHQGTITFESTVGKGTTFSVRLPSLNTAEDHD